MTPRVLDYPVVKNWTFGEVRQRLSSRDSILYALGVGFGFDPLDERQTRFVYERDQLVAPTLPVVLGAPLGWWTDPRTGVDYSKNLLGEQDLVIHEPLPLEGEIIAHNWVAAVHDRGPGRGALAVVQRTIVDAHSGRTLARASRIEILREAGGFNAVHRAGDERPRGLAALDVGETTPDVSVELPCSNRLHLIYRLSGDLNPLHVDHVAARTAGFERPILHGLATFGIAGHAVLRALCDYEPRRIRRLATRFSSPVLPGDTLRFDFWRSGSAGARFRATSLARQAMVLDRGLVELEGEL